ncbi:MAG: endonuclease [Planctomycetota bacterium]
MDTTDGASLRATLHPVIDDHVRFPYTSSATDTWDILELADEDPTDPGSILDVYANETYAKVGGGSGPYNREHLWPKSYGYPNDSSSNYPYTDCHALFLCDSGYNSSRSNKPYRDCSPTCDEKTTLPNHGQGGGSGVYPGESNWTSGTLTAGTWETWAGRRGDVARALFYLDVRYEGGFHGGSLASEPDLILTDDEALIAASNTGANESVGYMGMLSTLLLWHAEDPVDDVERRHNDQVYAFQGNRNPFVDNPGWVDCIFSGACGGGGGGTPPAAPTALVASAGDGVVSLDWADNGEADLAGYHVYRATSSGGPYSKLNGAALALSAFSDATASNGTTYYYAVTAVDDESDESSNSAEDATTPAGGGGSTADPWINELHYDNASSDVGEMVEVAGPAGLDLAGWQIVGYNGSGGGVYKTIDLAGVLPDQGGCAGALSFAFSGMQNGAPDGLALVDPSGAVLEFLSYEGTLSADGGPADGLTSTDIGVSESGATPAGYSLQRGGTGSEAADFTWQSAQADTPGSPNAGQVFSGGCAGSGSLRPATPTGLAATADDGRVDLVWDANGEADLAGYKVYRASAPGGPYAQANGGLVGGASYADLGLDNGTTYYYVVSAVTSASLESDASAESSGTPVAPVASTPWINELHYDDKGKDSNQFVELAGPAGLDLTGWKIVAYNGSNGTTYDEHTFSGTLANQSNGFGTAYHDMTLQNGAPDGVALVDPGGTVVEFLSYEGTMTATNGPADGLTSTDMGVSESGSTPNGSSLQLGGSGSEAADFAWQGPQGHTKGAPNAGQTFL